MCLSSGGKRAGPLALYATQLALNLAWTPLFFKKHALDLALADSVGTTRGTSGSSDRSFVALIHTAVHSGFTVCLLCMQNCVAIMLQHTRSSVHPPVAFFFVSSCAALLGVATAASVKMAEKRPGVIWPLMAPYLCWVTFATALTGEILRLNPEVRLNLCGRVT